MVAGTLSASTLEKRYVHKNGAAVWCSLTLTLLVDDVGAPYQFVGIVEDIDERRRSADKLRESESLLRLAGQTAHLGGWTYYYGSGEIVWSDEACAIFEVAAGAMPALAEALAFYRPGSIERVASAVERSQQTGDGFDLELEIETALGAHRWVRVIGQAEPERGRLIGGIQDITARKESELELVRMNRSLKMLSGCNEVLVRATGEAQLLADICTLAVEVGGYMMAWAGYARDDAERTIVPIVSAGDDEGYVANLLVSWDENQPGEMASQAYPSEPDAVSCSPILRTTRRSHRGGVRHSNAAFVASSAYRFATADARSACSACMRASFTPRRKPNSISYKNLPTISPSVSAICAREPNSNACRMQCSRSLLPSPCASARRSSNDSFRAWPRPSVRPQRSSCARIRSALHKGVRSSPSSTG